MGLGNVWRRVERAGQSLKDALPRDGAAMPARGPGQRACETKGAHRKRRRCARVALGR